MQMKMKDVGLYVEPMGIIWTWAEQIDQMQHDDAASDVAASFPNTSLMIEMCQHMQ